MVPKIFADTNIIIDFIEQRPFDIANTNKIFEYAENNTIEIFISESVVTNVFYITGLETQISRLLGIVNILCIDIDTMKTAMKSSFKDKEDGILYYGAMKGKADYFITRNKKDFAAHSLTQLPVMNPKEFILNHS